MSDAPSKVTDAAACHRCPVSADPVIYLPLPIFVAPVPVGAILLMAAVLLITSSVVARMIGTQGPAFGMPCMLLAPFIMMVIMQIGFTLHQSHRNARREVELSDQRANMQPFSPETVSLARAFFDLQSRSSRIAMFRARTWTWSEFENELDRRGLTRPHCAAESRRISQLMAIPLSSAMLEPEQVTSGSALSTTMSIALPVGSILLLAPGLLVGNWIILAMFGVALVTTLPRLPFVRRKLPWIAERSSSPIVGLGVIKNSRGKRWTVHDAMMLLVARSAGSAIQVYFVGNAGWLKFTFANETDPEFIKLWQRWNHPHPRPELLD